MQDAEVCHEEVAEVALPQAEGQAWISERGLQKQEHSFLVQVEAGLEVIAWNNDCNQLSKMVYLTSSTPT